MKIVLIVQARMTSTRLPGKILMPVLGKSLLEYQLERLRRVHLIDDIIIATTTNTTDDIVVNFCEQNAVSYYRGSEHDVLKRYFEAATLYEADVIVRVTSDCPLIDPEITDRVIQYYLDNMATYQYVSNTVQRTYPRGLDVEVFSMEALKIANGNAFLSTEREHVTIFLYNHPEQFRIGQVTLNYFDHSNHRWTVDTREDFELVQNILEELYPQNPNFKLNDILNLLSVHPEWKEFNADIQQKSRFFE